MRAIGALVLLGLSCSAFAQDDPQIVQKRGAKGGLLVLNPRVIGEGPEIGPARAKVLEMLEAVAKADGRTVEIAPSPGRTCPRGGCKAVTVGALLGVQTGGCVVVGLVGAPGEGPVKLVPLAGTVTLTSPELVFRAPPESSLTVTEFMPCATLLATPLSGEALSAALTAVR